MRASPLPSHAAVGVGLVTHRRPDFYERAAASIVTHLGPDARWVGAVHDGPDPGGYPQVDGMRLQFRRQNRGVAAAKNLLLSRMLAAGCDWLFLAEDDIVIDDPLAASGFVEACVLSGQEHLGFPHHGDNDLIREDGPISHWWAMPGAWTVTSRRALLTAGFLDEEFRNCHEHFEWTLRLAEHGFTSGWREFSAPTGCEAWLHEQPDAIATSTIRADPAWTANIAAARKHWLREHPTTARTVFGT